MTPSRAVSTAEVVFMARLRPWRARMGMMLAKLTMAGEDNGDAEPSLAL